MGSGKAPAARGRTHYRARIDGIDPWTVRALEERVRDAPGGRGGEAPDARERLRLRLLGIAPDEASFERRGFSAPTVAARLRLEQAGRTFIRGYRAALADDRPAALETALDAIESEPRGFAYEGAAMALALLDRLAPWRRGRLQAFIAGPARSHVYMAHVGAGWALARLRRGPRAARRLDPVLRWLALDGYGFHEGYFRPLRHLYGQARPARFGGYALRAFDQGLGRSLWFATGADPAAAALVLERFRPARRADLWSGVGLAAAYAGGATSEALRALLQGAHGYDAHLVQGAAFAAAARRRAGNPAAHTDLACRLLAGCSADAAAELADAAREDLPPDGAQPAYEVWRARIRVAAPRAA